MFNWFFMQQLNFTFKNIPSFLRIDAVARPQAFYGMGSGGISLDNLACIGTEERLLDCSFPDNVFCTNAEDAGVDCSENCKQKNKINNVRVMQVLSNIIN